MDNFFKYIKLIFYIPPIIFTIIYCSLTGWINIISIIYFFLIWGFIFLGIIFIFKDIITNRESKKAEKEFNDEIKKCLKMSDDDWTNLSEIERNKLFYYCKRQEKLIIREINEVRKTNTLNINIEEKVNSKWSSLSFEERIFLIKKDIQNEKNEIEKTKKRNFLIEKKEKEKEKEDLLRKQEEDKKIAEENAKREEIEREERKKIEEIKKQELLEERKKQRDREYKERIKLELLEKERKKQLESEAIQELIDNGNLSENFSLQNLRIPIPSHIKEAVWKRDKQSCVNCGSRENLEFDHDIPVSKGGGNSINNIRLLCQKCNRSKSNKIM